MVLGWPMNHDSKIEKEEMWRLFFVRMIVLYLEENGTMPHSRMIQCGPHCAALAPLLLYTPGFVLRCTSRGLQEAMKGSDLELLFLPSVGIYLPFSNLTENFTLFLRDLNIFGHKNQPRATKGSQLYLPN